MKNMTASARKMKVGKTYRPVKNASGGEIDPEMACIWEIKRFDDKGIAYGVKPEFRDEHKGVPLAMSFEWEQVIETCELRVKPKPMSRVSVLEDALEATTRTRAATHGDLESNFSTIAQIWSVRLGRTITPEQVTLMLIDLKTVRAWSNPAHEDNWVDIAGYAACGGELADGAS